MEKQTRTWFELGESYFSIGWYEQAAQSFEEAIRANPAHREAWMRLGQTYERTGRFERAVEVLEQAVQCMPGNPDVLYTLGLYYDRYERRTAFYKVREIHKALRQVDDEAAQKFADQFIHKPYTQSTL
jgi:cytochrome c-type biogenesis protein CcmH/NrfG